NGKNITVTINNDGVFINDAKVTTADIETDNGVVHVIDAVILPPATTVVDVIVNSEAHSTLEAAVIAAELDDDLSGEGPFTVFAPTDAAFNNLPEGTVDALLEDPTGDLADILLYHVVGDKVMSGDLSDGMTATTLNGKNITVTINNDGVFINDAKVTTADIETDNGVVHVIDAVMLPPTPTSKTQFNDFSAPLVYPNPTVNLLTIHLETDSSQEVQTTVYDMAGNRVSEKITRNLTPGVNQIEKDVSTLLPGLYFIQINNSNIKQTIKFVKR
ncbi:MAG TPA: fasciclin domain-containing protein, partial [Bacteroidales bacterium]|nr:fasciclin domain-containing protein [Bacteroidales bacterium]